MSGLRTFTVTSREEVVEGFWAALPNIIVVIFLVSFTMMFPSVEGMKGTILLSIIILPICFVPALIAIAGLHIRYSRGMVFDYYRDSLIRWFSRLGGVFIVCVLCFALLLNVRHVLVESEIVTPWTWMSIAMLTAGYPFFRLLVVPFLVRVVLAIKLMQQGGDGVEIDVACLVLGK